MRTLRGSHPRMRICTKNLSVNVGLLTTKRYWGTSPWFTKVQNKIIAFLLVSDNARSTTCHVPLARPVPFFVVATCYTSATTLATYWFMRMQMPKLMRMQMQIFATSPIYIHLSLLLSMIQNISVLCVLPNSFVCITFCILACTPVI